MNLINRLCIKCNNPIHPKRLELIPHTKTCVKCSDVNRVVGNQINFSEKEDVVSTLEIMSPEKYKEYYGSKSRNISTWDDGSE